jgi:DUF4097 and DUF4098 domain-containing protein YvlB
MDKVSNMKQGRPIALVSIFAAGLVSATAFADQEVNRTIDAADDGYIEVYNTSGEIKIVGWSRSSVEVEASLGDDVQELIVEREGNEILIKVKVPNRHHGDIDADLIIHVPENSSIDVSGVSADIEVDGILGEQSLQTVSGDVETSAAENDVEAASVSGDVEVTGSGKEADTEAATVSGDVILTNLAGRVDAESVSGDVEILGGSFSEAHLESVNGDLVFRAELQDGGDLSMESINGTVDIEFSNEVSARFDIETFNGRIRNCFGPEPERTSRYSPGLELSFTVGDGDSRVEVETLNGSVNICNQ